MKIAVFGAGGVGGYFGGRLAESGEDVWFIARGAHLDALRRDGLTVESVLGDFHLSVNATDDAGEVGEADVVLVATKAWQVPESAEAIGPMIGPDTVVIGLQNGVEAASQLASVIGKDRVAGGSCAIISFLDGPGRIRHAGVEPRIVFGELDRRKSDRLERLREVFERAKGLRAVHSGDIHQEIWRKFLFIAPVSGVGAVTRAPLGVCRSLPETREMIEQAMGEVEALAAAHDVTLPTDAAETALRFLDSLPADATASMQRDIIDRRPSELEAQNGAIVGLGLETGVATPVNRFIYSALLPQETEARERRSSRDPGAPSRSGDP